MQARRAARARHAEPVEATEIIPGLWMGSVPAWGRGVAQAGFDVLVLCAQEYQPRSPRFPGIRHLLHVPLDDADPTAHEIDLAMNAAVRLAELHREGHQILVTCMEGRNRSGLVAALTLHLCTKAEPRMCVWLIQEKRVGPSGMPALTNQAFVRVLLELKVA